MSELTKTHVDNVLVQADYMSGDRFTIASAMKLDQRLGVIIIAAKGHTEEANRMAATYAQAGNGQNRILIFLVDPQDRSDDARHAAKRELYKGLKHRKSPLRNLIGGGVNLQKATFGTRVVAEKFGDGATVARDTLRAHWSEDAGTMEDIGWYLGQKGFDTNSRYVFLWAKEGNRNAEKSHHFTSILSWHLLIERIRAETDVVPVMVGDNIGISTSPSLVQFWNDEAWKKLMSGSLRPPRAQQLALWVFLAKNFPSVLNVGMRSGAIEVPALLGIKTLYLEEVGNAQAQRMEKWIGPVPTYSRQQIERTPGIKQQIAWRAQNTRRGPAADRIREKTKHTVGMQLNQPAPAPTEKGQWVKRAQQLEASKEPQWKDIFSNEVLSAIRSVGGTEKFKMREEEYDQIVSWVAAQSTPASVRPTSMATDPLVRDPLQRTAPAAVRSRLTGQNTYPTYSALYSSKEYLGELAKVDIKTE